MSCTCLSGFCNANVLWLFAVIPLMKCYYQRHEQDGVAAYQMQLRLTIIKMGNTIWPDYSHNRNGDIF